MLELQKRSLTPSGASWYTHAYHRFFFLNLGGYLYMKCSHSVYRSISAIHWHDSQCHSFHDIVVFYWFFFQNCRLSLAITTSRTAQREYIWPVATWVFSGLGYTELGSSISLLTVGPVGKLVYKGINLKLQINFLAVVCAIRNVVF